MSGPGDSDSLEPVGPKASEGERALAPGGPRGLTLRAVLPNAITAAALCAGLTGVRFAINGDWERAVFAVVLAGLLDGIDGAYERAQLGLRQAQAGQTVSLDEL